MQYRTKRKKVPIYLCHYLFLDRLSLMSINFIGNICCYITPNVKNIIFIISSFVKVLDSLFRLAAIELYTVERWCIVYKCVFNVSWFMSIFMFDIHTHTQNETNNKMRWKKKERKREWKMLNVFPVVNIITYLIVVVQSDGNCDENCVKRWLKNENHKIPHSF